jgi:glutaredoxin
VRTIVLYSRRECHLCEQAQAILEGLRGRFEFDLRVVDIDADPELAARYGVTIPVAALDGEEILIWPFTRATAHTALQQRVGRGRRFPWIR